MKNKTPAVRASKPETQSDAQPGEREHGVRSNGNGNGHGRSRSSGVRHTAMLPNQPSIEAILMGPSARKPAAHAPIAESPEQQAESLNKGMLLHALMAFKKGDFSVRLPVDLEGIDGKI